MESGDPTVPAQVILAERQDRCIPPVCGGPGTFRGRRISCCTKVELYPEQTRDKVRRRFTLLVTARVGGTTGQAPTLLVDLTVVVVRDSFSKGKRQRLSRQKIIKCLTGPLDDLSSLLACTHYLHVL